MSLLSAQYATGSASTMVAPPFANVDLPVGRDPKELAHRATRALIEEAELTPKPGLVDRRGQGAHHDLSLSLLVTSAQVLRPYFQLIAEEAQREKVPEKLRITLGEFGREAESAMLRATDGTNTHRGAIWCLGLLIAGAARRPTFNAAQICDEASRIAQLPDGTNSIRPLPEAQPWRLNAAFGARQEAFLAFPHVQFVGLPALKRARAWSAPETTARIDSLLAIMATLSDTCILRRGGASALSVVQRGARAIADLGGSSSAAGAAALQRLEQTMLKLWVSPGGSADLLAATLFLDQLALPADDQL